MILIGQYDSPFVRRVAIALHHYALPFEHRPWSVWGDAEQIAHFNPLRRVPTLLLDDESALVETFVILDAIDEQIEPSQRLVPPSGCARRDVLRVAALAGGVADKAVVLLYSSLDLLKPSEMWRARCRAQVVETLSLLESELASRNSDFWFGGSLSHADIAVACGYRFVSEAHPGLFDAADLPKLSALSARCEALPAFQSAYLPITNHLTKA